MNKQITWTKISFEEDRRKLDQIEEELEDEMESFDGPKMPMILQQGSPYIMSLVGPISLDSNHNVTDYYDLWIIDTNFKLTEKVCQDISDFDGVEVFNPVSPYKGILGIAKLFNPTDVKVGLEYTLTGKHTHYIALNSIPDDQIRRESLHIYNKCKKHEYWLMYIFPNGNIEHFYTSDEIDYKQKFQEYSDWQALSQGLLLYGNKTGTP